MFCGECQHISHLHSRSHIFCHSFTHAPFIHTQLRHSRRVVAPIYVALRTQTDAHKQQHGHTDTAQQHHGGFLHAVLSLTHARTVIINTFANAARINAGGQTLSTLFCVCVSVALFNALCAFNVPTSYPVRLRWWCCRRVAAVPSAQLCWVIFQFFDSYM